MLNKRISQMSLYYREGAPALMLSATQVEPIKPMRKQSGRLTRQDSGKYQPN